MQLFSNLASMWEGGAPPPFRQNLFGVVRKPQLRFDLKTSYFFWLEPWSCYTIFNYFACLMDFYWLEAFGGESLEREPANLDFDTHSDMAHCLRT